MIRCRNMLKRVDESRDPCRTPTVVRNQSPILPLKRTALVAISQRYFITRIRLALKLYVFVVVHKAACNIFEGLLEVCEDMVEVLLVLEILITDDS